MNISQGQFYNNILIKNLCFGTHILTNIFNTFCININVVKG